MGFMEGPILEGYYYLAALIPLKNNWLGFVTKKLNDNDSDHVGLLTILVHAYVHTYVHIYIHIYIYVCG